jgi:membrane protease YdiL (CAAX protease family)
MDSAPIKTQTLLISIVALVTIEYFAAIVAKGSGMIPLAYLGIVRLIETLVLLLIILEQKKDFGIIGLNRSHFSSGVIIGIWWSLTFAGIAIIGLGILHFLGFNVLDLIKVHLPHTNRDIIFFFLVGGVIAPTAEELFFRGILFGYFVQWNVISAILFSSFIFVFFHPQGGLTQAVGGIVFAMAYYHSNSIVTPIIIHSLGNIALFSISLFARLLSL